MTWGPHSEFARFYFQIVFPSVLSFLPLFVLFRDTSSALKKTERLSMEQRMLEPPSFSHFQKATAAKLTRPKPVSFDAFQKLLPLTSVEFHVLVSASVAKPIASPRLYSKPSCAGLVTLFENLKHTHFEKSCLSQALCARPDKDH